jgi:hypothetical protein
LEQKRASDLFEAGLAQDNLLGRRLVLILREAFSGLEGEAATALTTEIANCTEDEFAANLALLLGAAFAVLRPEIVGELLTRQFCPDGHITVKMNPRISKHFFVLFEKVGHNEIGLTFSNTIARHHDLPPHMTLLIRVMPLLARVALSRKVPEGATFLNQWDAGIVPGLSYCATGSDYFLIPDHVFLASNGYYDLKQELAQNITNWNQRIPIAYWRGGTTGQVADSSRGWRSLPRVRLCELSQQYPKSIDAGLSQIAQFSADIATEIRNSGLVKDYLPAKKLQAYRYLIDIDGNSNAWGGLIERLLTGSPVLKVASERGYRQWYYDRLRPWHNYVPVDADMSDLVSKIEWLKNHDTDARWIGENGRALAYSIDYEAELEIAVDTVASAFRVFSALRGTHLYDDSIPRQEKVYSCHGTILAYSPDSKTLVHLPPESIFLAPRLLPLTVQEIGLDVYLKTPSGDYILDIDPRGNVTIGPNPPGDIDGAMRGVKKIERNKRFWAFQLNNLFMCAEADGRVAVSRKVASTWELFRVCSEQSEGN